jgi:branched-chain amino acid transport system substrate-binding protein
LGGSAVVESVKVGDKDMKPVLTRVAASRPALIYFPVFDPEGGWICAQMREVPGLDKTTMMGADGIFSSDFLKACGKNSIGMYFSSPDFSSFGGDYQIFASKYLKKYNVKETLAPFHAHAYDATNVLFAAIEKVAVKDPDSTLHIPKQALRDAIAATKNLKGLTGSITCDPYGDCADPKIAVYQVTADNFSKLVMPDQPIWKQTR